MIVGVSMVRDEADVIDTVLRHLLASGVDHLIVADNLSTDATPHILNDLEACGAPLTIVQDDELGYYQSRKMSGLSDRAADMGATWVLPFDADEIWYGVDPQSGEPCRISDALSQVEDDVRIVRAPGWDHIVSDEGCACRGDPDCKLYLGPFSPFRRPQTQQLAKVAYRASRGAVLHMGNHDVSIKGKDAIGPLAYRHFQYRSLEQMTRKLRNGRQAYEASDIHPLHGTHWRAGGLKSDDELAAEWAALCATDGLVFDPAPILA